LPREAFKRMSSEHDITEIRRKSSKGIKWQTFSEIFIRIFQFTTTIVLARLLLPDDFGLISVALIFTQLAFVVFDFGFSAALIQKKRVENIHYSTTFSVYLLLAVFFIILIFASAPLIASFFGHAVLQKILRVQTIIFGFYALSAIPRIRLIRAMRFKRLSGLQMMAAGVYGAVAVSLAWLGWGVWSFVLGSLAEQFILTLLLFIFSPWRLSIAFDRAIFKGLLSFGGSVMGSRLSSYINNNTPAFIIGKLMGTRELGFFSVAYQLVEFPVQRISKNILRVLFPAFSKLQDDSQQFTELFLQTVYYLGLIILPVFAGIMLVAPLFVHVFYGAKWQAAILPLQILTLAGLLRSFWVVNSVIFLSKGKPQIEFHINLFYSLLLIPGIYFAAQSELEYVAAVMAGSMLLILLIGQARAFRLIELKYRRFLKALKIPFLATAAFLLFDFGLETLFLKNASDGLRLTAYIAGSVFIYAAFVLYWDRKIFTHIKSFLGS